MLAQGTDVAYDAQMNGPIGVLGALAGIFAAGCVVVTTPNSPAAQAPAPDPVTAREANSPHVDRFPETIAILARAEGELAAGRPADAVRSAAEARGTYVEEKKALKSPGEGASYQNKIADGNRAATHDVTFRRVGVAVAAEWSQGHDLAALAALHDHAFHPGFCGSAIAKKCEDVWREMREKYPHLWAPRRTELTLFPRAGMDRFLATFDMETMDGFLKAEGSGTYVVYAFPTESSTSKSGKTLIGVRGTPGSVMVEQCTKVGKLRIQEVDFDVSRCGDVRENLVPAVAKLEVSPEGAALVASRKKGEAIALLIESANVKRRGNTWDLGETRAFWVGALAAPLFSGDGGD